MSRYVKIFTHFSFCMAFPYVKNPETYPKERQQYSQASSHTAKRRYFLWCSNMRMWRYTSITSMVVIRSSDWIHTNNCLTVNMMKVSRSPTVPDHLGSTGSQPEVHVLRLALAFDGKRLRGVEWQLWFQPYLLHCMITSLNHHLNIGSPEVAHRMEARVRNQTTGYSSYLLAEWNVFCSFSSSMGALENLHPLLGLKLTDQVSGEVFAMAV